MKRSMGGSLAHGRSSQIVPEPVGRHISGWFRGAAALVLVGFVVGACSSSAATATAVTTPAPTDTPAPVSTPAPTDTPAPVSTPAPSDTSAPGISVAGATGVPTAIDPCQLITSQEASQFAGASFGAGVESTTSGNGRICTYGGQTLNVFMVVVGQAPDVATAQAGKADAEAAIQQQAGSNVKFTELPNFADGAAYITGNVSISGQTIGAGAIYALKGTVFFGFSDLGLGKAAPTVAALQAQAQVMLSRLP